MKMFDSNYKLLDEMYQDEYYPDFLVDKVKAELQKVIELLERGETDSEVIQGKLDDQGSDEANSGSGQLMAFINAPEGRICSWGIPLAESYGVRLPADYSGEIPKQMQIMDVPEGEYIVFEHGPFNYQTQNQAVEQKIEEAMKNFDYAASGFQLDTTQGRVFYFYHDSDRFWKYVRPVKRTDREA